MMMSSKVISPSVFTPADANPLRWFDMLDTTVRFQDAAKSIAAAANNDPIYAITDKGSIAADIKVIGGTATKRPLLQTALSAINNKDGMLFDGVDDCLISTPDTTAIAQPCEMWFVLKQVTTVNSNYIAGNERWDATDYWAIRQFTWPYANGINAGTNAVTDWDAGLNWNITRLVFNGTSSTITVNNGTPISANFGTLKLNGLSLGARYPGDAPTNIMVAQFFMSAALSSGAASNMWTYYGSEYGIAV